MKREIVGVNCWNGGDLRGWVVNFCVTDTKNILHLLPLQKVWCTVTNTMEYLHLEAAQALHDRLIGFADSRFSI
jgi:hypothetical protein